MPTLEELTNEGTRWLEKSGFRVLDQGGDRHGAREWSWLRERNLGKGHCYVSLDVIESSAGTYEAEVWAGADDEEKFGRRLILPPTKGLEWDVVLPALDEAASVALKMDQSDMPHSYQVSLPARQ